MRPLLHYCRHLLLFNRCCMIWRIIMWKWAACRKRAATFRHPTASATSRPTWLEVSASTVAPRSTVMMTGHWLTSEMTVWCSQLLQLPVTASSSRLSSSRPSTGWCSATRSSEQAATDNAPPFEIAWYFVTLHCPMSKKMSVKSYKIEKTLHDLYLNLFTNQQCSVKL